MPIRKAVIAAAGWGTRFLPATKAIPKELVPIVDRPGIQWVVEEAAAAGVDHVVIVTSGSKRALEDHFDRTWELERLLERKGNQAMVERLRRISSLADFSFVRQSEARGLGHAVLTAQKLIGNEPFALLLPDDVIDAETPVLRQMIDVFDEYGGSVIAVEEVPHEDVSSYGVIDPEPVADRVFRIRGMVEKPPIEEAPSDLTVVGRYILTPEIFRVLADTPPGRGGEIQLTDAMEQLRREQSFYGYQFRGIRYDAGTPFGFIEAVIELAIRDPELGERVRSYLRNLDVEQVLKAER
ncbi:MAG TPA: UTP--glucose-1-phosphate uridylyltransferase GalU [Dehalococcoidia bacterium]|nr:UTP--glucose-1-phosphate uridylyltransferase GalU [Dehalococcoidia bacterium]